MKFAEMLEPASFGVMIPTRRVGTACRTILVLL
jgi:hypothetical protein